MAGQSASAGELEDAAAVESLIRVALGANAPETVIQNATVLDVVSGEFVADRSVWISGGRIARVAPASEPLPAAGPGHAGCVQTTVIDASGLTIVPGLIDGHTHVVDLFIPEFVRALLPTGVTSAVIEAMEYGASHGFAGIQPFIEALRGQPLRLFYTAPALCGLTEEEEPAPLTGEELGLLLADPLCLGLGESYWSNALLDEARGRRVRAAIAQTLAAGKVAEGHTAGARGARLDAYVALGVSSCHEPISVDEALEVYRRGLLLMLRHGGIRRDLGALRPLLDMDIDHRRLALVTDSVDPERLHTWGYLDQVVREALASGIRPEVVYRMASTNVAEHFRIGHRLGSVAPGRWADLVAIPGPTDFRPVFVMVGGRLVFDRGAIPVAPRPVGVPPALRRTVGVDADEVLALVGPPPAPPETGAVRVIEHVSSLVTQETVLSAAQARVADLVPVLAVERTRGAQAFWGFVKGFGFREGAYATTASWDSPDMVVVGRDARSVATAIARVAQNGGGRVFARGGEVVAELASPVCAVASLEPGERVRAELGALSRALETAGVPWESPLLSIDTLTSPAIPHLRLTHRGYVRLRDRAVVPREA